ncbi:MarR family winged helix-turn-helix transcriptional regulator [Aestuariimicrobium soli]|uniref:MarR family winged helix-turn-helix transcriptional regulator n=1 Tax=Aestuariimicrobium soli TaxID=2035834 RepID=UPI003EB7142F
MSDTSDDLGGLLMQATRGMRRRWAEALEPVGISPHEFRALATIDRTENARVGVVAQELRITPRSATEVIDALERATLVTREPDPTDRRAVVVRLTDHGRAVLATAGAARRASQEAHLAGLDEAEREQLAALLRRVLETSGD